MPESNTNERDLLARVEKQQVLLLQKLEDLTGDEGLLAGCSSTESTGCSSVSRGCSIKTAAGTLTARD